MRLLTDEVLLRPFPAHVLGAYRIVVGVATVVIAASTARTLLLLAAPSSVHVPVFSAAPPVTARPAVALSLVWIVAALLLTVGARTGAAAIATVACASIAMLWDQQVSSNHLTLVALLAALLGLAQAGAAWSVDAWRNEPAASVPLWGVLLLRTQITTLYFFTAVAKTNGPFLRGDVLEQQVPMARWLGEQLGPWVLPALAIATVAIEFLLAFGLWFRLTRTLAVLAGVALHLGILVGIPGLLHELIPFGVVAMASYTLFLADDLGDG